jgi:hypothetical protein
MKIRTAGAMRSDGVAPGAPLLIFDGAFTQGTRSHPQGWPLPSRLREGRVTSDPDPRGAHESHTALLRTKQQC